MKRATLSRSEAQELADRCSRLLREQFGAKRVILFGSAAGDAPWHSQSDLDLAVEGLSSPDYWPALTACYELLPPGMKLDLILMEAAWPELRARLEGTVIMPEEPAAALAFEVGNELKNLERLVERLTKFLEDAPGKPDELQIQGIGKYIHDFYNGAERIFERIAVRVDGDLPAGPSSHTLLLQRMGQPFAARPAVIDRPLEMALAEQLRFRHLFRHTYGYDLEWGRVAELGRALPALLQQLSAQLAAFLVAIEKPAQGRDPSGI
jgi:predicted nucleotidyltransferase